MASLDLDALQKAIDGLRAEKRQVERDRAEVCKLKEVVQLNLANFQQRVKLNVGGCAFETSLSTLQRYPDSMLGTMFSGRAGIVVPVDEDGFVFIDRSGSQFGVILDFLRTGKVRLPSGATARAELADEADYYLLRSHMEGAPGWRQEDAPKCVVVCTEVKSEQTRTQNGFHNVVNHAIHEAALNAAMTTHEAALNAAMKKEPGLRIVSTNMYSGNAYFFITILATRHHERA